MRVRACLNGEGKLRGVMKRILLLKESVARSPPATPQRGDTVRFDNEENRANIAHCSSVRERERVRQRETERDSAGDSFGHKVDRCCVCFPVEHIRECTSDTRTCFRWGLEEKGAGGDGGRTLFTLFSLRLSAAVSEHICLVRVEMIQEGNLGLG